MHDMTAATVEFHLVRFSGRTASAAFVAALSRYLDSPDGSVYLEPPEPAEVWIDARICARLGGRLPQRKRPRAARAAFAPVPVSGTVPGVALADGCILLIGSGRSPAWGMAEVERLLATI